MRDIGYIQTRVRAKNHEVRAWLVETVQKTRLNQHFINIDQQIKGKDDVNTPLDILTEW